jgi:hypothetical protein
MVPIGAKFKERKSGGVGNKDGPRGLGNNGTVTKNEDNNGKSKRINTEINIGNKQQATRNANGS